MESKLKCKGSVNWSANGAQTECNIECIGEEQNISEEISAQTSANQNKKLECKKRVQEKSTKLMKMNA